MTIEISWLIQGQLCLVNFSGVISAAEIQAYDKDIASKLDTVPTTLHFIADMSRITSLPPLGSMVNLGHLRHPRLGRGLTVGLTANPLGRFLISLGAQMVGVKQKDFNTLEEARAYLQQMEGV